MLCPSEDNNRQPFNGTGDSTISYLGDNWVHGNYGANAGAVFLVPHGIRNGQIIVLDSSSRCFVAAAASN